MLGRGPLSIISTEEKQILQQVKSIDDVLVVRHQFATIISLRMESNALSVNFVASNMAYIANILGIELNEAQRNDVLDEIGQVGWLTMADFKLFLDRMKKHKFYRRDYQELLLEFWKYADERLERAFEVETAKVDKVDTLPRGGETLRLNEIEVMKIKADRYEKGI
jgi:hypothetical protein